MYLDTFKAVQYGKIVLLGVDEPYRGQGIGKMLVKKLMDAF